MAPPVDQPASGLSNLHKRLLSAAVLLPVVILAVVLGSHWFTIFVIAFAAAMAWEWASVIETVSEPGQTRPVPVPTRSAPGWILIAAVALVIVANVLKPFPIWFWLMWGTAWVAILIWPMANRPRRWYLAGFLYIGLPACSLVLIRNAPDGLATVIWMVAMVVAADTGGYLVGRSVGGPKLWPKVSPNKTWSGLAGAVGGAALAGLCTAFILNHTNVLALTLISAVLGVLEQGGDLVESALKRHFGVKDTSQIIPGHGGVLDRVDGLLAVAVAVLVLNEWAGGSVLAW